MRTKLSATSFAVLLLSASSIFAFSPMEEALLRDEIMRHVVDECDLYSQYKKNRIDFDPVHVSTNILPDIHEKMWRERQEVRDSIFEVVQHQPSFYKRALMYNVYYNVCLSQVSGEEAQEIILNITNKEIANDGILEADSIVDALYGTQSDADRANRDGAKIEVMNAVEDYEKDARTKRKTQSVAYEIKLDIEFWSWNIEN